VALERPAARPVDFGVFLMNTTNIKNTASTSGASATKTRLSPRAGELLTERTSGLPVWIRSPKTGPDYFCGFSRSKLYDAATKGHIRSVSIREPGQMKGTRLFNLASILAYIEKCEQAATKEGEVPA
jgi:hypothetical protein